MIISSKTHTSFQDKIADRVFIILQADNKESWALCAKLGDIQELKIDELIMMTDLEAKKLTCKVLYFKHQEAVLNIFESFSFKNFKPILREQAYEIFFVPHSGVVKVTKPNKNFKKHKVLIVDDSKTICNFLSKIMSLHNSLEVVATLNDPLKAKEYIDKYKPDVITLDIYMPGMNGVELLKSLGPSFQIPVVMISSLSMEDGPMVLEALESGAVDYIQKPEMGNLSAIASDVNEKVINAAMTKLTTSSSKISSVNAKPVKMSNEVDLDQSLIVIGSSTGGTKALKDLFDMLPSQIPPILVVQHIPAVFSRAFADRLNSLFDFEVKEAQEGDQIEANTVYIAPGGQQMKVVKSGSKYQLNINDDPEVNRFKPSVDYLFESVVNTVHDKQLISVILTGMGNDGAKGMLALKRKGAKTIAQNEQSCVVYGMPKEAVKLDAVDYIEDLYDIAPRILSTFLEKDRKAS